MTNEFVEQKNCPGCKKPNGEKIFSKGKFSGITCSYCGLIYITPILKNTTVIYCDNKTSSPSNYYIMSYERDFETFDKRLKILEKYITKNAILDIGCSVGTFLSSAKARGWKNLLGIEPNPISALICKQMNIPVINDFFTTDVVSSLKNKFDAVHAGDLIEHIQNPVEFMSNVFTVLKDDGKLILSTPNFESPVARLFQIKPLEHLLYFTQNSIKNFLELNNFEVRLLMTTSREKSLKALPYSTTFNSSFSKLILKILVFLRSEKLINFIIRQFIRDEILVIAQKTHPLNRRKH